MLIDWFTVAAQIVNFLILVWLLKKLLYGPILRAIDDREAGIAAQLSDAAAKEARAREQGLLYDAKLREFEREHDAMLERVRDEADRTRAEMLEAAREQIRDLETKWRAELDRQRNEFLTELRGRASKEILALTARVVSDLASAGLQNCAVEVFLDKLHALDEPARAHLTQGELCVRSAAELPEAARQRIQRVLEERLATAVSLRFEQSPGMGLGLELRGDGWRVGWNSESYLETLEEEFKEAMR